MITNNDAHYNYINDNIWLSSKTILLEFIAFLSLSSLAYVDTSTVGIV